MEALKIYEFDPKILEHSMKVMDIQDILVYSNSDNYKSAAINISQKLIDKEITPLDYSYCIYTIERYDSIRAKHFAQITAEIGQLLLKKQEILQELKNEILDRIFFITSYPSTPHILLYFLEKTGFYEGKDFLDRIVQIKRMEPKKLSFIMPFIVWFLPLFEKYDPYFYEETIFQFQNYRKNENGQFDVNGQINENGQFDGNGQFDVNGQINENGQFVENGELDEKDVFFTFYVKDGKKPPFFNDISFLQRNSRQNIEFDDFSIEYPDIIGKKFYDPVLYSNLSVTNSWFFRPKILASFKKNDWSLHTFLCEHGYFPGSIEEAISTDDLDHFLSFLRNKTVSYDTKINYNIFCHSHVLNENTTLIEYSAITSSVKIFNYLINTIEADRMHELTNRSLNVCFLAVYSGCSEILKICDKFNVDLDVSLSCAACFYRHEILSWLVDDKNDDVNRYLTNYLCPLHQAASSNNLRGLFYLLLKGADINKSTDINEGQIISPCIFGIEFGGYHTTSLLLSSKKLIFEDTPGYILNLTSYSSDVNIFKNVFKFFNDKNLVKDKIHPNTYIYSDINVVKFILDKKENLLDDFNPLNDLRLALLRDNFLVASLIFNQFRTDFRFIDIDFALNIEFTEVVKIFIDDELLNSKKKCFDFLLKAIRLKRLDIVKIILLKLKVNEFDLADLFDVFEIKKIDLLISNSTSLFFKVFKYEEKEFFLFNYFLFCCFLFYFFIRIINELDKKSNLAKKAKKIVDILHEKSNDK